MSVEKQPYRRKTILEEIYDTKIRLNNYDVNLENCVVTGKFLSEALLFGEHGENMLCTEIVTLPELIYKLFWWY